MHGPISKLRNWFSSTFNRYVRYGATEKEILDWLKAQNYRAEPSDLSSVQLFAIQRPGWIQVYRFEAEVRDPQGTPKVLFGALRSDERYGEPAIFVFEIEAERDRQLRYWSEGMIVRR